MAARYALVLAFALGAIHFNGASARAEKCSTAAPDDIGRFFSSVSFPGAPPVAVGSIPDKRVGRDSSFVRFSVRSYFMETSGSALSYEAVSSSPGVARAEEMCGSMLTVSAASAGAATITVTASSNGMSATQTVTVIVADDATFVGSTTNSAPVVARTIADTTFTQKTPPITLVVSRYFSDPDPADSILTYTAGLSRAGIVDTSITDSTLTLTAVSKDTVTVTVTATDRGGLSVTQSFQAEIENSEPDTIRAIPNATIAVGDSLVIDLSEYFEDPDGDTLTYDVYLSDNVYLTRSGDPSTITIHGRATGRALIAVVAFDGDDGDTIVDFFVEVVEGNQPPVPVGTIPAQTLTLGGSSVSFDVSPYFEDPDGDTLTYTVSNPSIVTAIISPDSTLTLTPVSAGMESVTATATDPDGESATQVFKATVVEGNRSPRPVGTIAAQTLTLGGSSVSFDVSPYFEDLDGDTLTYTVSNPSIVTAIISPDSTLTLTPVSAGMESVTVTATDPDGESATQVFKATVVEGNRSPRPVGTIAAQTLTLGGSSVSFDVSPYFEDPDGDTLTYTVSNPSIVTAIISPDSTLTLTPVSVGMESVTVTASDEEYSATQVFTVTVGSTPQPLSVDITMGPETMIASGEENTWEAEATGGVPDYTYSWEYSTRCIDGSLIRAPDDDPCIWQWTSAGTQSSTLTRTITTAESYAGVRVRATDSAMPTASSVMDSVIVSVNHAPDTVGVIADRTLILGHPDVSFDVARFFSDPDGNSLTYEPESSSDDTVGVSISGSTLTLTAEAVNTTAETVAVTATDPGGLSSPAQEFAVTVEEPSTDPTVFITGDNLTSIESGTAYTWGATVTGGMTPYTYSWHYATQCVNDDLIRAEPCEWQWTGAGSGSSYTRTITTTESSAQIRLIVSDSASPANSVTKTLQVTVTQPSGPTPVGTISDRTLTEGGSSSSFSMLSYFRGPNVDDILTYSASSSNTSRVTASMSGASLTIRPVAAGSARITVTASLDGESAEQHFDVTVNSSTIVQPPNRPPVAEGTISKRELTLVTSPSSNLSVSSYFSDPDGDNLTYSASSDATGIVTTSMSGSTLTITAHAKGTATITVTATDPGNLNVTQEFDVDVPNRPPAAEGTISDRELTLVTSPSASFGVAPSFSDPDGDNLTYSASSDATGIVTTSMSGGTLTITAHAKGTATITVTATDPGNLSAEQEFDVDVPNRSPVAEGTMPARKLTLVTSPSASFGVSSYFSDPDGDNLTWSATSSSASRVTTSMSGSTLTITAVATGAATVTVTADDGEDDVSQSFDVTVHPRPNRIPVVDDDIPDQTLTAGGSAATFDLSDYFSDPDNDVLTYSASSNAIGIATASASGSTLTITPVSAGTATLTVIGRDQSNAGAIQSVGVTVSTAAGLTASIGGPSSVTSPGGTTWTASVSGGATPYTYSWRYQRTCSGGEGGPGDRAAPPCTEWVSGGASSSLTLTPSASTTIELTVTDANDDSVTATLSVFFNL